MITREMYKSWLAEGGQTLGNIRKNNSQDIINSTFTNDPSYKQVRVLTRQGQKIMDAKYVFHQDQSISKDAVDWYLQFRPGVEFPIGTIVIVPDDNDTMLHTQDEEKDWFKTANLDEHEQRGERTQLQFIVNRNSENQFVYYNILQCNQKFQQIYNKTIQSCIGAVRNANSYTSGIQDAKIGTALDNVTSAYIPDLYYVYGNHLQDLDLDDPRTIQHDTRFMITNNSLYPQCYRTSKVMNVTPAGIIQLTMKQCDYDETRDNTKLRICDYYSDMGDTTINTPFTEETNKVSIVTMDISNGVLSEIEEVINLNLAVGTSKYIGIKNQADYSYVDWNIKLDTSDSDNNHPNSYYENLIKVTNMQVGAEIKVSKARSLVGKHFLISATDTDASFYASMELEVTDNAT